MLRNVAAPFRKPNTRSPILQEVPWISCANKTGKRGVLKKLRCMVKNYCLFACSLANPITQCAILKQDVEFLIVGRLVAPMSVCRGPHSTLRNLLLGGGLPVQSRCQLSIILSVCACAIRSRRTHIHTNRPAWIMSSWIEWTAIEKWLEQRIEIKM